VYISREGNGELAIIMANVRRPNSSTCDYEVVVITHPPDSFHYLALIVGYDFNSFHLDSQGEAESREEGGIGVDGLDLLQIWCNTKSVSRILKGYHDIGEDDAGRAWGNWDGYAHLSTQHLVSNYQACGGADFPFALLER
jgi:hypothetical protein